MSQVRSFEPDSVNSRLVGKNRLLGLRDGYPVASGAQSDSVGDDSGERAVDRSPRRRAGLENTAELLTRVTARVAALTAASQVLEARVQWLFSAVVAASVVSVVARGLALLAW
jgi:hypothetical protein